MNVKFDRTPKIEGITSIAMIGGFFALDGLVTLFIFLAKRFNSRALVYVSAVLFVIALIWIPLFVIINAVFKGSITTHEDGIEVVYGRGRIKLLHDYFTYGEIRFADCKLKQRHRRYGYYYILSLEVKTDGGVYEFHKRLNITNGFTKKKYELEEFLGEQPLMQLCNYINEQAGSPHRVIGESAEAD